MDPRLWEIQRRASQSSAEKPSREIVIAASLVPPAPRRGPRAGKMGRRLGQGRGAGGGDAHCTALWPGGSPLGCLALGNTCRERLSS